MGILAHTAFSLSYEIIFLHVDKLRSRESKWLTKIPQ